MRRTQQATFASRLEEHALLILCGDEQVGKTQFVLHALHAGDSKDLGRTLYIELQPGQGREMLLSQLLRALAALVDVDVLKWSSLLSNADVAMSRAIDVADEHKLRIVIDGLDWLHATLFMPLFNAVNRYVRQSQWIFIGRGFPNFKPLPDLERALFNLPSLTMTELQMLAAQLHPDAEKSDHGPGNSWYSHALQPSFGRPGRFVRLLEESTLNRHFKTLSVQQNIWMDLLATLQFPANPRLIASAAHIELDQLSKNAQWQELIALELIQRVEKGWRISHDVAYPWQQFRPGNRVKLLPDDEVLDLLASVEEPTMVLERLRILLKLARFSQARELLIVHSQKIIGSGYSPELWDLLHNVHHESLAQWRLLAGVHCGVRETIDEVRKTPVSAIVFDEHTDFFHIYAILSVTYYAAQYHDVASLAARCLDYFEEHELIEQDYDLSFRFSYMLSSAHICLGELEQALRVIEGFQSRTPTHYSIIQSRRASIFASMQRTEESLAICEELSDISQILDKENYQTISYDIVRTLVINQRFSAAKHVLDKLLSKISSDAFVLTYGRRSLILQVIIQFETAQHDLARAILNGLLKHAKTHQQDLTILQSLDMSIRIERGDFEGLETEMQALFQQTRAAGLGDETLDLLERQLHLDLLHARRTHEPVIDDLPHHDRSYPLACKAQLFHQRVRWNQTSSDEAFCDVSELHGLAKQPGLFAVAQHAAMHGDSQRAQQHIRAALDASQLHGQTRFELWGRYIQCENSILLSHGTLSEEIAQFCALADALPSQRYRNKARFLEFFGSGPPEGLDALARLETLAEQQMVAPIIARRAGYLLGKKPQLDEVDMRIVRTFQDHLGWSIPQMLQNTDSSTHHCWGIHAPTRSVWHATTTRTISLDKNEILWKLLLEIARHDGVISKEELINQVWEIDAYHPLQHDNRLRLAASKLRRKIQSDLGDVELITANEQGYQLSGTVRFVAD